MQIQIGQTVHYINSRRGRCQAAVVTEIPLIPDPEDNEKMVPDVELGTIDVQVFGNGGYYAADYEPKRPVANSWHTLEECTSDNAKVEVTDR